MFDYDLDGVEVRSITCGMVENNSYIVINGSECILIDPAEYSTVNSYIECLGVSCAAILLTHAHYDHISGVAEFVKRGVPVYVHEGDVAKCTGADMGYYLEANHVKPFTPSNLLNGGENLSIAGLNVKVIHTPGHSKGGVCYVIADCIFSGDTLFKGSYGRYDFYDGNLEVLKQSINTLFALEGEYKVYPGHGRPTQLSIERKNNPILWS